jgi:hypothetical protein
MTMQCFRHCNQFLGLLALRVFPRSLNRGGGPIGELRCTPPDIHQWVDLAKLK